MEYTWSAPTYPTPTPLNSEGKKKQLNMKFHYIHHEVCNLQYQMNSNELEVPNAYLTTENIIKVGTQYFTLSRQSTKSDI